MMTLHKLSAGDGYTYLTKQVAVADQQLTAGQQMTDYYAKGENPGIWAGSGIAALGVSGVVREDQMQSLFGEGLHPDADVLGPIQLGEPYRNFTNDTEFKLAYKAKVAEFRQLNGRGATDPERIQLRIDVAKDLLFKADPSHAPSMPQVQEFLAVQRRSERHAVAGYDLVFSPAKSISTLWALAPIEVSEAVEAAHTAAWREVLEFLEAEAALTRTGKDGIFQVETKGLVVTAFDHRTSRTGDPDLHTHMVVSNKVQGLDGKWRALDARVLHSLAVTASEMYNARVENNLRDSLGVAFTDVEREDGKRSVREIVGVDQALMKRFSQRRSQIDLRLAALIRHYRTDNSKDPSRAVQAKLAEQANLETREAKGIHHSLAELRAQWRKTAHEVLGRLVPDQMVKAATANIQALDLRTLQEVATDVLDVVSTDRSTWNRWHVRAEAERQLRAQPTKDRAAQVDAVEKLVLAPGSSIRLTVNGTEAIPQSIRRSNGESMLRVHGAARYSSQVVMDAERDLCNAGHEHTLWAVFSQPHLLADLNQGQRDLVEHFTGSATRLAVGVGPAGSGKTTAMRAVADTWKTGGGKVIGLAPSANAAQTLSEEIGVETQTIARLLTLHRYGLLSPKAVRPGDMLLVDEAGTASTRDLDDLLKLAQEKDAIVRLLGDPEQLSSVDAGGALRLLVDELPSVELSEVHRFHDPDEAVASLQLRVGEEHALDFYTRLDRIHAGTVVDSADQAYMAWRGDDDRGETSIMLAKRNDTVQELNERVQGDRIAAGQVTDVSIELRNGQLAGIGEHVLTRSNDSQIQVGAVGDRIRNGELWTVLAANSDRSLQVQRIKGHAVATLPADYVARHVDLGYASTVNRAQGMTVDHGHVVVEPGMTRQELYVAMTRGRESNDAYVPIEAHLDADIERAPDARTDAISVLGHVLGHDGAERSATEVMRVESREADRVDALVRKHVQHRPTMPPPPLPGTARQHSARL
jgi:conjugative relaxase-like TrwC/TraI family protein